MEKDNEKVEEGLVEPEASEQAVEDSESASEATAQDEAGNTDEQVVSEEAEQANEPIEEVVSEQPEEEVIKLKVFGKERFEKKSKVLDAGVRTLQKQLAADQYLEEAKKKFEEAEERLKSAKELSGIVTEPKEEKPELETPSVDFKEVVLLHMSTNFADEMSDPFSRKLIKDLVDEKLRNGKPNTLETYVEAGGEVRGWLEKKENKRKWDERVLRKRELDRPVVGVNAVSGWERKEQQPARRPFTTLNQEEEERKAAVQEMQRFRLPRE
jgi:hypothetical protein